MKTAIETPAIVPREKLDFGLNGDIPKYWFDGDPFKTRLLDALSTVFPEGERFFIMSVREFRDQISDPQLQQDVQNFVRQEGQHTLIHNQYNARLKSQGMPVERIAQNQRAVNEVRRVKFSKGFNVALTAAAEHITAIMTEAFFDRRLVLAKADPRMRALWAWHSFEELEHKAVAFDVMRKVAKVGYFRRCAAMVIILVNFNFQMLKIANIMLRIDGFEEKERKRIFRQGLKWLYGPGGMLPRIFGHMFSYFKPGYHPWQQRESVNYKAWLDTYNRTGDMVAAGDVLFAAGT